MSATRTEARDPHLLTLVAVFLIARVIAYFMGVHMDVLGNYQWQLIDPALLEARLFESLWYLHSQPPLFNAVHGLVLKLTSSAGQVQFAWGCIHLLAGLTLLVTLYRSLLLISVPRVVAALLTALFVCSPAALAYESFLSYTYVDAALLSLAVFLLLSGMQLQSARRVWLFFLVLAALCLTRAAYHLVWLVGVTIVLLWHARGERKMLSTIGRASACAIALVVLVYAKNWAVFGVPGPSSWAGMNLATMTHTNLPVPARERLVASGQASPLTLEIPFVGIDHYPEAYRHAPPTGIPVLDNELRTDRSANFNQMPYIKVSADFGRDALVVMRTHPEEYFSSAARNVVGFLFRSSTDYRLVAENVSDMRRWDAVYSVFVYGQFGSIMRIVSSADAPPPPGGLKSLALAEVVILKAKEACLFVGALVIALPCFALLRITIRRSDVSAENMFASFAFVTFAYVFLTTNLVNFGESHRMRFEIEPLFWVLGGWLGCVVARRWTARASHRGSSDLRAQFAGSSQPSKSLQ